jgi:hypothetical protein
MPRRAWKGAMQRRVWHDRQAGGTWHVADLYLHVASVLATTGGTTCCASHVPR